MTDAPVPHTIWSFRALIIILSLALLHMAASWSIDAALGKRLQQQLRERRLERTESSLLRGAAALLSFPLSLIDRMIADPVQWRRYGKLVFVLNSLLWGLALYLLWRLAGLCRHKRT